jgi:hypothetical protein
MALSKKKSRLITIGDDQFRWLVSSNSGYNVFVAEKEAVKGCKIEVYFERYKHKPGSFQHSKDPSNLVIIKPGDAAAIISQAQELGWLPEIKGKPVVFDLEGKKVTKRD